MDRGREEGAEIERREKVKKKIRLFAFLVLSFSLWECGQWGGALPENVLALINQEEITFDEFNREFKDAIFESGKEPKGTTPGSLKRAYLDQVIERKILAQEARRSGIKISDEELNQIIIEIKKDYPGEGFGEKLGLKGMTLDQWKGLLKEKLLAEKVIRENIRYRGKIDDKEALQYYETHRSSFQLNRRVRARQIIVADGEEAIQILKRLKRGEDFGKLAKEKSLGPEKVAGGDLGYFSAGERPAEFDPVFTMEVGTISEVIKSPYGYHIFKLEGKVEPREISFEEVKPIISQELRKRKGEEEYQRWLKGLKSKATVKINKRWLRA
jgi:peptidyl-prolyl cis-trans isomerase C